MDKFIELRVVKNGSEFVGRLFNIGYIKSVDTHSCTVLLHGNIKPFKVTRESMDALVGSLNIVGGHERK